MFGLGKLLKYNVIKHTNLLGPFLSYEENEVLQIVVPVACTIKILRSQMTIVNDATSWSITLKSSMMLLKSSIMLLES